MKQVTQNVALDPTHSFDVADAIKYGSIEKALIVKELRNMQLYKLRHGKNGWVYYSAKALSEKFPYMKRASIDRWMKQLVDDGHLEETVKNKMVYDRTKSYRLPVIHNLAHNEQSNAQSEQLNAQSESPIPPPTPPPTPSQSPAGRFKKTEGLDKKAYAKAVRMDEQQAKNAIKRGKPVAKAGVGGTTVAVDSVLKQRLAGLQAQAQAV